MTVIKIYNFFTFQSSILAVGYVVCQSLCVRRKLFEVDNKSFEKWRAILINSPIPTSRLFENTFPLPPNFERRILPVSSLDQQSSDQELSSEQVYGPLTAEEVCSKFYVLDQL